ncbi:hypothetical protein [Kutzneria buriramensis]|uniref:Peptidase M41 domain-containing protein n=1 Tax=Kutzneria buriramensis TaxID=1045776 RepID=A0A3E0GSN0_9PSEU|nr:hypothetical protein [Kutzneria buriramensis]REH26007.1 hypothetical protein BCF44_13546 [Kutzneria buriramensis]
MSRNRADVEDVRPIVAAHEVGHLIAFQLADVKIIEVRLFGSRIRAEGYVQADVDPPRDAAQAHAVLVGVFAGVAAGHRWCDRHGLTHLVGEDVHDRVAYRDLRRKPLFRDVDRAEAVADARRLVRRHWSRIERLAPVLAARGFLPPDAS